MVGAVGVCLVLGLCCAGGLVARHLLQARWKQFDRPSKAEDAKETGRPKWHKFLPKEADNASKEVDAQKESDTVLKEAGNAPKETDTANNVKQAEEVIKNA